MPAIDGLALLQMEKKCEQQAFLEGVAIVLKLLNNIIQDPNNVKYRTFKLENKTIREKVLVIEGMKEYLLEMGFVERTGTLHLSQSVLINNIIKYRDVLQARHDYLLQCKPGTSAPSKSADITHKNIKRPRFQGVITKQLKYAGTDTHPFLLEMTNLLNNVLQFEDEDLQAFGKSLIPVAKLSNETQERMRAIQKEIASGRSAQPEPYFEDIFVVSLVNWFQQSFFTWVNSVSCQQCGGVDKAKRGSTEENGTRIETAFCCNKLTKFYRYNEIAKLLVTRRVIDYIII